MKTTTSPRTILVVGFILLAFNVLFLFGNGLFMLVAVVDTNATNLVTPDKSWNAKLHILGSK